MKALLARLFSTGFLVAWACVPMASQANTSSNKPTLVIRFSHVVAEQTPKGLAALEFKKLVEQRSKGKIRVEVYPDSSMYKDKEELEALQLGAVHMLAPSLAKLGQLGLRQFEVFDLPFLFSSQESLEAVKSGEVGRSLLKSLDERGITGLAFWDNGFKVISANQAVKSPTDLRGRRFRIQASRTLEAQVEEWGGIPIPMAFSEVYDALESGFVDATENPLSNFQSKHMYQVQKHLTLSYHGYLGYAVIVNKKFWDQLPSDTRNLLNACLAEATRKNKDIAQQLNNQALQYLRKHKQVDIAELSAEQRAQWKVKLAPVYRRMENSIGPELIDRVRRIDAQVNARRGGAVLKAPDPTALPLTLQSNQPL